MPQSGPVPDAPPRQSFVTLGIIQRAWIPAPYPLPVGEDIAHLIPAPAAASNPPPLAAANLAIIQSFWKVDPVTVISLPSVASLLATPPQIDAPPPRSNATLNVIVSRWTTPFVPAPIYGKLAPLIPAAAVPDAPPKTSYANLNTILARWIPPYFPPPKLTITPSVAGSPIQLNAIPSTADLFNTGTHAYDLSLYFSGATSYSISPAVEPGWTFVTGTGVLTIDTDANGIFGPYTVTATNPVGSKASNIFTVTVATSLGSHEGGTMGRLGGMMVRS